MRNFEQHQAEIQANLNYWEQKPVLRTIYDDFYRLIIERADQTIEGKIVEIGSGIGNLKKLIPNCICTDVFNNPWIDQTENAYKLSFKDDEISNLILFDVWHHLEFPVVAINEFQRVLTKKGRILIFEPCTSLLGDIVYGLFHPEGLGLFKKINTASIDVDLNNLSYYAAQGNASRFFFKKKYRSCLSGFSILYIEKIAALAYILSGGYSKKQLFPDKYYPSLKKIESGLQKMPAIFATRLLVVLEKI